MVVTAVAVVVVSGPAPEQAATNNRRIGRALHPRPDLMVAGSARRGSGPVPLRPIEVVDGWPMDHFAVDVEAETRDTGNPTSARLC